MTETGRLETFSDGVFAIAITLLVLGIGVPEPDEPLVAALVDQWPAFLAYVVSFLTIGIMWINHHQLFTLIGRSNTTFALIHVVFLMFIAFLPYSTDVMAERLGSGVDEVAAMLLYGGTTVAIAVMYNVIWLYAAGGCCGRGSTRRSGEQEPAATSTGRSATCSLPYWRSSTRSSAWPASPPTRCIGPCRSAGRRAPPRADQTGTGFAGTLSAE